MSCGAGLRRSSDPALLWLWCRPAARALIRPLAWEPPYAEGTALKKKKKRNKETKKKGRATAKRGLSSRSGTTSAQEPLGLISHTGTQTLHGVRSANDQAEQAQILPGHHLPPRPPSCASRPGPWRGTDAAAHKASMKSGVSSSPCPRRLAPRPHYQALPFRCPSCGSKE